MKIEALTGLAQSQIAKATTSASEKADTPKFGEALKGMLEQVDDLQNASGKAIEDFVAGKDIELHEVMAIGEEAQISFQFMMAVRNRILESYQELSRMPT